MASEEISLVLSHCPQSHHSHLLFQDDSNLVFRHNPPHQHQIHRPTNNNHNAKTTRELTAFIEHQNRHYQPQSTTEFRRSSIHEWDIRNARDSSSDSDDDNDDDDDDMDDVNGTDNNINNNKNSLKKNNNGKISHLHTNGNDMNNNQQGQLCQYQNAITIADPNGELYYSQLFNSVSGAGFKDMLVENGCGFSGRKDGLNSGGSGESLRTILSDPLTGTLMDDAMILTCGHSFGSNGLQHVMRMKACYTCSYPVSENSMAPNLSLRSAVHAFLREEELQANRAPKRRHKLDQDKSSYGDLALAEQPRGRGVQFPFSVSERVLIKGNKRTPPRFVGREAIVTTQCLNGWYVVKTLDNAESVKLQYRSLAKVQDSQPLTISSTKIVTPNWL